MKFATLKSLTNRDGMLCLVDKKLKFAVHASPIAQTLQEALENWSKVAKPLQELATQLEAKELSNAFPINMQQLTSPLPRAYQWLDGSVYLNHVELVRKSRGATLPDDATTNPLMYQGGSDTFLGPYDPIPLLNAEYGLDFEAEVAIITDDVPLGTKALDALEHIKLIMLVNDVSMRNIAVKELQKGFGFLQAKPSSSFSPIALTPDELGAAWQDAKIHLPLYSYRNDKLFGEPNAGDDMAFSFVKLIEHAAKTRSLAAGTIIGSGTVSNRDRTRGSSCIVERRTIETLDGKTELTPYLQKGETVRIEMLNNSKENLFGSIIQKIV
ncbi:MAG: 2-keto-4-pentenoate hydratase [Legionellales bacterium RIFCSPHIGHO2_12_FULL_37_14]|nr:MAG: 2-keto-4-pentenoate hydratase [Legionellales bacterium RIFCSPHIGHO2_12_FULL_37_14]